MTRFEPMGGAVAHDRQEGIVQAVRLVPCGGVVFYASVPGNSATSAGCGTRRTENSRRLATLLWEHLRAKESLLLKRPHFSNRVALPVQLVNDTLGRPHLLLGEHRGPAISFSTAGGGDWSAPPGGGWGVGVRVAGRGDW